MRSAAADMSTSNGVSLTGTAGLNPSIGVLGTDFASPLPDGVALGLGANIGGVTVGPQARDHQRRPGDEEGVRGLAALGHD